MKFSNLSIGTKLACGFGVEIVIAAGLGIFGVLQMRRTEQLVTVVDNTNAAIQAMLNARRMEKNFVLRGFEKYGSDTKNSFEKWQESRQELLAQLEVLGNSACLTADEHSSLDQSVNGARRYDEAFQGLAASRAAQDAAFGTQHCGSRNSQRRRPLAPLGSDRPRAR